VDHVKLTESRVLVHRALTEQIIGLAIDVHRNIRPGLLGSVYSACLCLELERVGLPFEREVMIPVVYKGTTIPLGFRADIVVKNAIILEIKAVAELLPVHEAQLLTYLRMSGIRVGLLMNFHALRLKDGLQRFIV
jgi:GxxExxY protein